MKSWTLDLGAVDGPGWHGGMLGPESGGMATCAGVSGVVSSVSARQSRLEAISSFCFFPNTCGRSRGAFRFV